MKKVIALTIIYTTILFGCSKNSQSGAETIPSAFQESVIEEGTNDNIVSSDSVITTSSNSLHDSTGIDFNSLGITEYEYPEEFVLEDDIKAAIELSIGDNFKRQYGDYGPISNYPDWYRDSFINNFIKEDGDRYEYKIKNRDGMTREQIEYIYYSLTGRYIPFDNIKEPIVCSTSGTPMSVYNITDYEYELDGDDVLITANATRYYRNKAYEDYYVIHARLTPNKYSCFNGYSIEDEYQEEIPQWITHDNKEHKLKIYWSFDRDIYNNTISGESYGGDLTYSMYVTIKLTDEQIEYIKGQNGNEFEVTWDFIADETLPITTIEAKTIEAVE